MPKALLGPYELSYDAIKTALPENACGIFALGYVDATDTFRVQRVGRDDSNLRSCLKDLIGSSNRFKYATGLTPKQAFEAECELFHTLRPPGNIMHPDRPKGSGWVCPVCLHHQR